MMARRERRQFPTESAGSIFRMLMRGRPTEPEVWPNGLPGPDIENGQNPYVITTNATGYDDNPKDYLQTNGLVEITNPWVRGLKLTLSAAIDKNNETNKVWQTPWTLYYWDRITYEDDGVTPKLVGAIRSNYTDPRLTQSYYSVLNTNLTGLLNYDAKIGAHTINILAGVTKETFKADNFVAFRRNYISPALDQLFVGGVTQTASNDLSQPSRLYNRAKLGYYGRVNYNYKEKYLAEFLWRYDGSYMFPEDKRFGFFPGILLGWNLTNENFFHVPGINYLKLRGSYGQMGNDQVFRNNQLLEYAYLSSYGFGSYPINGQVATTLNETILANSDFTWEVANNYNVGLDATVLNNHIDVTLEYFFNKRSSLLIDNTGIVPASSGIQPLLPPVNNGRIDNTGFEFTVAYKDNVSKDLWFRVSANGGYAKNTVKYIAESHAIPEYQWQEGKPYNAFVVYKSAGAFKDQAEIDKNTIDYSGITGQLIPGDMKFEDVNGDGKITSDDAVRLDKGDFPNFNYGATIDARYKSFDLSILFQGASGAMIRVQTESGDIGNYLQYYYDHRWTIDHPSSTDPRLAIRGDTYFTGGLYGNNTYYLFSKNYFRMKNIELGYTLPAHLMEKAKISNFRIFVNALNLFTISKMDIFDPEATAGSGVYYPQSRVLNVGFSVTF